MIIDCILDRKDGFKYGDKYSPHDFYFSVFKYGGFWADKITRAMDHGTEKDVKKVLCDYITENEYNPLIKDYINAVSWLSETPHYLEAAAVIEFNAKQAAAEKAAEIEKLLKLLKRGLITVKEAEEIIAAI